jgi:hypothetical protein
LDRLARDVENDARGDRLRYLSSPNHSIFSTVIVVTAGLSLVTDQPGDTIHKITEAGGAFTPWASGSRGIMPVSHLNNPEHWFERTNEARAVAEDMIDPISKQRMLEVAASKGVEQRRTGKVLQRQDGA